MLKRHNERKTTMIVSNFAIASRSERRAVRFTKYALQITNLEDQEIEFAVECHVCSHEGQGLATSYLNDVVRMSIQSEPFKRRGNVRAAQGFVRIGAKCSILYELSREGRQEFRDDVEIRGFIVLRVPPASTLAERYFRQPQTDHAVKVLLHARREDVRNDVPRQAINTDGFLSEWFFPLSGVYSSEAIAISSGRAENDLKPEGRSVLGVGSIRDLHTRWTAGQLEADELVGARDLEEKEQAAKLVDLLLALRGGTDDLEALNQLLAVCDAEVRVRQMPSPAGRRKPK
jgi:hypothetical protein